jgi:UDP-N-acetyl-D-galactosamine dehydrogenase
VRNTKVAGLVRALEGYGLAVDVVDPVADADLARHEYGIEVSRSVPAGRRYHAGVLAVTHADTLKLLAGGPEALLEPKGFLLDIKGVLAPGPAVLH